MADATNTYALVVGIENYEPKSYCGNLDGPALDALKFCKWLRVNKVPENNICLFTSELKINQDKVKTQSGNLKLKYNFASAHNIYQAITKTIPEWGKKGELLYIYWSGHGFSNGVGDRRFFYQDGKENLHLNNLIKALKTKVYGKLLSQVLIFDGCATFYSKKAPQELKVETYQPGTENPNCQQVLLFATREGQLARNISVEQTGLFSKVLLQELSVENRMILPSEVEAVMDRVKIKIRKDYKESNSPISVRLTNNPEEYFGKSDFPVFYSNLTAQYQTSLENNWNELIIILGKLKWEIIVGCCTKIIEQYSQDPCSITSSLATNRNWVGLKEILLEKIYQENDAIDIPLVLVFVENLLTEIREEATKNELISWRKNFAQRAGIRLDDISKKSHILPKDIIPKTYNTLNPFLLIFLEDISISEFKIQAELVFQENHFSTIKEKTVNIDKGKTPKVHKDDICKALRYYISETSRKLLAIESHQEITIEIFLPRKYFFDLVFENHLIEGNNSEWFGSKYNFVTRYYDRCKDYAARKDLSDNWALFKNMLSDISEDLEESAKNVNIKTKMTCLKPEAKKKRWKILRRSLQEAKTLGLNLDLPLLEPTFIGYHNEILNCLSQCGIPFSFWLRNKSLKELKWSSESQEVIQDEYSDFLKFDYFNQPQKLLAFIKKLRQNSFDEEDEDMSSCLGYHIGFLYDNPYRIPSKFNHEKGEDILFFENNS